MAHLARTLLNEVRVLIVLLSMIIIICVVAATAVLFSLYQVSELRSRSLTTAQELASLLERPLYNVDNESAVRIAKAFLSSGRIAGVHLNSTASGQLLIEATAPSSLHIPAISHEIHSHGMHLGSFTITFSDGEIRKSQMLFLVLSLAIVVAVLLSNIGASRYITRRVQAPFLTIFSGIEQIAKGDYQARIPPTDYQDLDNLVAHFNDMAAEIDTKVQEQKRVEEKLLTERRFLVDIIDFLPDATFIIDNDHTVFIWNRAAEAMTGVSRDTATATGDFSYAEPFVGSKRPILIDLLDGAPDAAAFYPDLKRTEQALYAESYVEHPGETQGLHLWEVAAPIFDRAGNRTGAIEMIRDVTDLKLAEQEKQHLQEQIQQNQKLESVGRLAGGIAHDFNNMLTIILGHAQLALLRSPDSEPRAGHLRIIEETTHRSSDLVRQLLAFARKQPVTPRVIDLNESIDQTLKMLTRLIGENISINWKRGAETWTVFIDPSQVDQLLLNLCVNARDAIRERGKITLETTNVSIDEEYCRTNPDSSPGDYLMLSVSDNGCGMDRETLKHIYEPFYTTKAPGKGTGMGLATVYGIVRQNGGFINAYSEPGQGTVFRVYLPRYEGEEPELPALTELQDLTGQGETILVVEDESFIANMFKEMLERLNYRVLVAQSPAQAIACLTRHQDEIQLLITDVVMPEMNGRDLEVQLKKNKPDLKVLFTSGYTSEIIARHGVLDHDVCFLEKPFSFNELGEKVRHALSRTSQAEA